MKLEWVNRRLETDYYTTSTEHLCDIPWCYIQSSTWHILLPKKPAGLRPESVLARPVTSRNEPDGWRWRLEIGGWHLPLYYRCLKPFRPSLIPKYAKEERSAVMYCGERYAPNTPQTFSSVGLQIYHRCPLFLVRDTFKDDWIRRAIGSRGIRRNE